MFTEPSVGVVTGVLEPLELQTEGQVLADLYTGFYRGFQIRRFDLTSCVPAGAGAAGAGASMAFRRQTAIELALFDNELDAGTASLSGGDHYAMYSVMRAGYTLWFNPSALAWHRHRRTMEELEKAVYGYGSVRSGRKRHTPSPRSRRALTGLRWHVYPVLAWRSDRAHSRPRIWRSLNFGDC
ncbi:MAG: hypothetical protein WKF37_14250 [Bryobacteraceae bacterium]